MARRGDSSEHHAGDFIVGASKSVSEYTSSNKSRLGGAAGSTLGMVAGAVLLGPVGLVAGSIAGGVALSNALKDKKASPSSEDNTLNEIDSSLQQQDIDFLVSSTSISVCSSFIQQQSMMTESGNATTSQHYHHQQQTIIVSNQTYEGQPSHVQGYDSMLPRNVQYQPQNGYSLQGQQQSQYQANHTQQPQVHNPQQQQQQQQQQQGYKFGDFARKVVAKGKEKDGRQSNDSYKFGDFTRGLFKK
jgi:hypothetical protein